MLVTRTLNQREMHYFRNREIFIPFTVPREKIVPIEVSLFLSCFIVLLFRNHGYCQNICFNYIFSILNAYQKKYSEFFSITMKT